jgi:O-antigen/teichoic acid export membrane protein
MKQSFKIVGGKVQPDAILKRWMRFKSLAARDVSGYVLGVVVAVAMAMKGAGYWAIVAFPITVKSTAMVLSWLMVHWKPSLPRRGTKVGSLVALPILAFDPAGSRGDHFG